MPHTGSCTGTKCANITPSSLLPELEEGNIYPGVTACTESCGGPGCDCFYWSSGCLFYRIYLTPLSIDIYELFHCNRWSETANVEITHFNAIKGKTESHMIHMRPNIPVTWNSFTYTLTSITIPPTPMLNVPFISNGNQTAIWPTRTLPPLQCNIELQPEISSARL
ncbi:hypothetical protein KIN20_038408 [Parelaphostrongylus tenuis]|uniref:Phlebovirus glycoprotein G2 fusion domain-containing protein n=1 Tax=Parelaphostrongylus tenuis TaxID=148309 RepID=A0AAD5MIR6_PARTN|nr:hypothetical protein KIN20_038408 [Parelaphostrongylus tenuis]